MADAAQAAPCGGDHGHLPGGQPGGSSAVPQGKTTDHLIARQRVNPLASNREMDAPGCQPVSWLPWLCAMAIGALGMPVISLTGWQAGMFTNTVSMERQDRSGWTRAARRS